MGRELVLAVCDQLALAPCGGKRSFPIPLLTRILPIPHLVRTRFLIGEQFPMRYSPEDENDFDAVQSLGRETEGAPRDLIELALARRVGIDLR